jgi:hypothetical protein
MHPTHTCFDDAAEFCMRNGGVVVHGLIPHPHAWVEHEGKIWQGGVYRGKRCFYSMPMADFFQLYSPTKMTRYPRQLYLTLCEQFNHSGPWRDEYKRHNGPVTGASKTATPIQAIFYED